MDEQPELRRELTTLTLTLYGVGVMVGAGVYVLIGKIVGILGGAAWLAFVAAALAALPTGLSYAELASRHPHSAGEAIFADRAFGRPLLTFVVGFLVFASGVASTAAVGHGFFDYLGELWDLPNTARLPIIAGFLLVLALINHRGIRESTWINSICTIASVVALALLIGVGIPHWSGAVLLDVGTAPRDSDPGSLVIAGAALAFYAFIGFEDICNVADEVRSPSRAIPRAILLALGITTLVYVGIAITLVCVVPATQAASDSAPLVELSRRLLPSIPPGWLAVVALLAVTNTALFNQIMCSRMLWGMARDRVLPPAFAKIHPRRRTPTVGIWVTFALTLAFALTGFLRVLAEATNIIILLAFFAVNLSLLAIRRREAGSERTEDHFRVPIVAPILGVLTTAYLGAQFSPGAYLRAAGLLAAGALLYLLARAIRTTVSLSSES